MEVLIPIFKVCVPFTGWTSLRKLVCGDHMSSTSSFVCIILPPVKRGGPWPLEHFPDHRSAKQTLFTRQHVWEKCPRHCCPAPQQGDLHFMFPSAFERCCRHLLPVPAGCYVSGMLHRTRDGRMRPPISSPNLWSIDNAFYSTILDFPTVMRRFSLKSLSR